MKISPHVSIYKFPITALSSITNRATGMFLSTNFVFVGTLCMLNKEKQLYNIYENASNANKSIINALYLFPLSYHTLGGIRHLIWDAKPSLLTNSSVQKSSIALFVSSSVFSFVATMYFDVIRHYTYL